MRVREALAEARSDWLMGADPDACGDAMPLLMAACGWSRERLYAALEDQLPEEAAGRLRELSLRRSRGEPLAYIVGSKEFMGLSFQVSPAVLVPRPETELMAEWALGWLSTHSLEAPLAVDVGTGSGCLGISLARYSPGLRVLAVDSSRAALEVARNNAARHVGAQVALAAGDLLNHVGRVANLVCANLPYIPRALWPDLPLTVRGFEPAGALIGGDLGIELNERLLKDARDVVVAPWALALELDPSQAVYLQARAVQLYPGASVRLLDDLSGRARCLVISGD